MVIAGRYAGSIALGAIGSTSSLINLLINIFIGLSIGANVCVAHFYGAGSAKDVSETVHTAILLSVTGGVFIAIVLSEIIISVIYVLTLLWIIKNLEKKHLSNELVL